MTRETPQPPPEIENYGKVIPETQREEADEEIKELMEKVYEILRKQKKISDNIAELHNFTESCNSELVGAELCKYIEDGIDEILPSTESHDQSYWVTANEDEKFNDAIQSLEREAAAEKSTGDRYHSEEDLKRSLVLKKVYLKQAKQRKETEEEIEHMIEKQPWYQRLGSTVKGWFSSDGKKEQETRAEEVAKKISQTKRERKIKAARLIKKRTDEAEVDWDKLYQRSERLVRLADIIQEVQALQSRLKGDESKVAVPIKDLQQLEQAYDHPAISEEPLSDGQIERIEKMKTALEEFSDSEKSNQDWKQLMETWQENSWLASKSNEEEYETETRTIGDMARSGFENFFDNVGPSSSGSESAEDKKQSETTEYSLEDLSIGDKFLYTQESTTVEIVGIGKDKARFKRKDMEQNATSTMDFSDFRKNFEPVDTTFGLESQEKRESETCTLEQAYKIARETGFSEEDIIMHTDVNETYDLKGTEYELEPEDVEIQSTPKELKEKLEKAKETDIQFKLAVRPNLTMQQMVEKTEEKFEQEGWGKPVQDPKEDESFYTNEKPNKQANQGKEPQDYDKAELALITTEPIPDSKYKNYLEQTKQLIEFVQENNLYHNTEGEPKEQFQEALKEFKDKKDEIQTLLNSPDESITYKGEQWKKAADILKDLKINQLLRHSAPELLSDMITNLDQTDGDERIFEKDDSGYWVYSGTNSQWDSSHLADLGDFNSIGADVFDRDPHRTYVNVGASLSVSV